MFWEAWIREAYIGRAFCVSVWVSKLLNLLIYIAIIGKQRCFFRSNSFSFCFKIYHIISILLLSTYIPALERFRSCTWKSPFTLFLGGLYMGGLYSEGNLCYWLGGLCSGSLYSGGLYSEFYGIRRAFYVSICVLLYDIIWLFQ